MTIKPSLHWQGEGRVGGGGGGLNTKLFQKEKILGCTELIMQAINLTFLNFNFLIL